MKPILSLSTSWCSHRHKDGYAMLREIADLGFASVELSHGIRITLVPGILKAVEEGVIKVATTHNFCPLPTGVVQAAPNLFEPSAREHQEHDQWLRHTKRSIDFAAQVKARALVCHLGSVSFFGSTRAATSAPTCASIPTPVARRTTPPTTRCSPNRLLSSASAWGRFGSRRRPASARCSTTRSRRA